MVEINYLEQFIKTASRLDKARYYDDHINTLINAYKEQEKIIEAYHISKEELNRAENVITAANKIYEVLEKHGLHAYIIPVASSNECHYVK